MMIHSTSIYLLYETQKDCGTTELCLSMGALNACIAKQDDTQIQASLKLATALDLDGTPAVFVNGERVNGGAVPTEELWAAIDRALRAAGEQPPAMPPTPAATPAPAPGDKAPPAPSGASGAGGGGK